MWVKVIKNYTEELSGFEYEVGDVRMIPSKERRKELVDRGLIIEVKFEILESDKVE